MKKKKPFRGRVKDPHRINEYIIADPVRLVGDNVEQGVYPLDEALKIAEELELDYLIEVHDEAELSRVEHFKDAMIGVNNRDLKTFTVDLDNSVRLKHKFKHSNIFIAESGIKNQDDIDYLKSHQIHAFLIGESLMRDSF